MKFWLAQICGCATALAMLAGQPGPARADLIVNGGFEDPVLAPGAAVLFTPGQTIGSAGWIVLGNSGTNIYLLQTTYNEPVNGVSQFNSQQGFNSTDLSGAFNQGPSTGVRQLVATTVGQQYSLSYWVGRVTPNVGPSGVYSGAATIDLRIDGGTRVSFTNANVTNGQINWKQFSATFTATNNNTTIDFLNGTPVGTNFLGLDNVSLVAVPELPGDYNHDDIVDAADYVVWRKTGINGPTGYDTWRTNFGKPGGSGSTVSANATVPEPTTLVMFIVTAVGIRLRRRQIA